MQYLLFKVIKRLLGNTREFGRIYIEDTSLLSVGWSEGEEEEPSPYIRVYIVIYFQGTRAKSLYGPQTHSRKTDLQFHKA